MRIDRNEIDLAMVKKQMNISDLAEHYGVTRQRMSIILNSYNLSARTVGKLAAALGVDPEEIIVTKEVM